jgi:L-asparagine transporter-like permease
MVGGGKRDVDTENFLKLHAHAASVIGLAMRRRRIALVTLMGTALAVVRGRRAAIFRRRLSLVIRHVMRRVWSIAMLSRIVLRWRNHSWVHSCVASVVVMRRRKVLGCGLLFLLIVFFHLFNRIHAILLIRFTFEVLLFFGRQLLKKKVMNKNEKSIGKREKIHLSHRTFQAFPTRRATEPGSEGTPDSVDFNLKTCAEKNML